MRITPLRLILLLLISALALYFIFPLNMQHASHAKPLDTVSTQKELELFTSHYYQDKRTDLVSSALRFIDGNNIMLEKRATAPLLAFFNRIFHDNPSKNEEWSQVLKQVKVPVRVAFLQAMNLSETELLKQYPVSPMKSDMYWGLFFASGDLKYVQAVVDLLKDYKQDKALLPFLAAGAAKWSLAINVRQHEKVRNYLQTCSKKAECIYKDMIDEILTTNPKTIHEQVMTRAKENKTKGLW